MNRDEIEKLLDGTTPGFLIKKHGGYYRPNCSGYTSSAILAGRYTEAEAIKYTHPNGPDGPRNGMTYVSEDAVTDEDFAAYTNMRQQRDDLVRTALALMAQLEDAKAAQALVTWHPFDTAPRDGSRFLAQGGGLDAVDICSYNARVGCWNCGDVTLDDMDHEPEGYNRPTLWMPLAALADPAGVEALAALRAERDADATVLRIANDHLTSVAASRDIAWSKAATAEAERDDALARLAAAEAQVGALREALDKARDPGRDPDYCYDEEWDYTMRWDEAHDLLDGHDLSEPVEFYTLFKGPRKWAVNVPNSWDEEGIPDGWDTEIFDSEAAARAALASAQGGAADA